MANIKSQIKRNRQNEKRRLRNKAVRSELLTREKAALAAAGTDQEEETLQASLRRIDKAAARGVPTAVVDHREFGQDRAAFEAALVAHLDASDPDIICLAGFMRVLTPEFVDRFAGRILNIHPSLLPKHRGLDTYARALDAGDREFGATVHEVTAELDDGPILGQVRLPIEPGDTPASMAARLSPYEHELYVSVLKRFAIGKRQPILLP